MTYVITTNGDTVTADTIPAALAAFAAQLRDQLPHTEARWTILDPAGFEHPGWMTVHQRRDQVEEAVTELCDELYPQLHRSADGYRGV